MVIKFCEVLHMDNFNTIFRKTAFGGFNREDVINYIEKTRNDFYDYKIQSQKTINDLTEKIKDLEEQLKNTAATDVNQSKNEVIDFSSSVTEINKAADHLRETADKICDDIGGFIDRVLNSDFIITDEDEEFDPEFIMNQAFSVIEEENAEEIKAAPEVSAEEDTVSDETNNDAFDSIFSHIITEATKLSADIKESVSESETTSDSILDAVLSSAKFSI